MVTTAPQLDGAATSNDEQLVIIGATNRPHEIDEAARRRLAKRLYIPLPCEAARKQMLERMMRDEKHSLTPADMETIVARSAGYSGSDMSHLCKDAAIAPLRDAMRKCSDFTAVNDAQVCAACC